ncbi:MAG: GLPGLI family protein [Weeksellaceae bacterium]|nr:GLPGLI family protein [Weeksellaceae bacterium]
MKKIAFALFMALVGQTLSAQSSRFIYEVSMKPNASDKSEVKTELAYLDVGPKKSVYYGENRFKRDSIMQRMRETRNFDRSQTETLQSNIDYIIEKDFAEQQVTYKGRIGRDQYEYVEDRKMNWKILPETVRIGDYKTQKAETDFGGRKWTAWFTSDLPFQEGPYKFSGLPGLIVTLEDADGDYGFNLKEVKKISEPASFDARGTTVKLKRTEYEKQWERFSKDPVSFMRSQMSSGRAGGPGQGQSGNRGGFQPDPQRMKQMENRLKETLSKSSNSIEK